MANAPEQVSLRFNEPVDAEFDPLKVYGPGGDRVDRNDARPDPNNGRILIANLTQNLPKGSYELEYRVTSVDGHVIDGRYEFAVTEGVSKDRSGGGGNGDERAGASADRKNGAVDSQDSAGGASGSIALYSALSFGAVALVSLAAFAVLRLRRRKP